MVSGNVILPKLIIFEIVVSSAKNIKLALVKTHGKIRSGRHSLLCKLTKNFPLISTEIQRVYALIVFSLLLPTKNNHLIVVNNCFMRI